MPEKTREQNSRMAMESKFIQIRSGKFPILPGEDDEIINEGMYGKALGEYLRAELAKRDYEAPFVCAEDWGWWVELKAPFRLGVCIYSDPTHTTPTDYVCTNGGPAGGRSWSWRKFAFIETAPAINRLNDDLVSIFRSDPDIELVATLDEFPY